MYGRLARGQSAPLRDLTILAAALHRGGGVDL